MRGSVVRAGGFALACALAAVPIASGATQPQARRSALIRDGQASRFTAVPPKHCPQGQATTTCVQLDTEVEPSIAANPSNHLNAVAAFQSGRVDVGGDADNGYATTFDGGRTWMRGLLPGLTKPYGGPFDRASDPAVAFGPNGIVYVNSLVFDDTGLAIRSGLAVNVSRDGGRTWGAPVFLQDDDGGGLIDKNWIGVDLGAGPGHHVGRVYVVWDRVTPILAAYSDDEGKTWQRGPKIGYVVYPGPGIGAVPLVLRNGALAVLFEATGLSLGGRPRIVISTAPLAGTAPTGAPLVFGPPLSVAVDHANGARQQRSCDGTPAAAVDPNSGQIYVVWEDGSMRTDLVDDVVLTRSDNGGLTWTSPIRVDAGPTGDYFNHFCGAVDVGPSGDVRVAYRTRQEAAVSKPDGSSFGDRIGTLYQESFDHGATFTAPISITTVVSDIRFAARSSGGAFLGDYQQLAAAGPYTYVVREEPVRMSRAEAGTFPPTYHHQRTWVAVLGPAQAGLVAAHAGKPKGTRVAGKKVTRAQQQRLAATGIDDGRWGALLLLAALVSAAWSRRRAASR